MSFHKKLKPLAEGIWFRVLLLGYNESVLSKVKCSESHDSMRLRFEEVSAAIPLRFEGVKS